MGVITDSTTTLDTTWVEQSIPIPAFTAGAMSTLSACVDEVGVKLQRGALAATSTPSDAQVKNWLMRAKLKLMQVRDFSFARKFATTTLAAGGYRIVMPPDYQGGEVILRDTTNNYQLRHWPIGWFRKTYPDISEVQSGEPAVFAIANQDLYIAPPATASAVLELEYSRSGAESTAGDMSWLPEYERFLCCDFAVGQSFESLHMWQEADRYNARWNEELKFSMRADGRRKWKTEQLRVIDVFQEYYERNSQK